MNPTIARTALEGRALLLALGLLCTGVSAAAGSGIAKPVAYGLVGTPGAMLWTVADHLESDRPYEEPVAAPMQGRLILMRHADRDPGERELNATGRARANALVAALDGVSVDAIFIADFRRNTDTAAPLAAALGIEPEVLQLGETLAPVLAEASDGRSVIWIGNVGNISQLWDAYRLPGRPPIEYGQIAILTAESGRWKVTRRVVAP